MGRPTDYDFDRAWTRQPCDTEARWRCFQAYRDQPPPRTMQGASNALDGYDLRTLQRYGARDGWPDRCAALDRYLDEQRVSVIVDVLAEDARAVANRHAAIARDAITCAHSVVQDWLVRIASGEHLDGWSPGEVRGMLRDMIVLERLVRGETTERVDHGLSGVDLSRLSMSEIETLRLLEAKAGVD